MFELHVQLLHSFIKTRLFYKDIRELHGTFHSNFGGPSISRSKVSVFLVCTRFSALAFRRSCAPGPKVRHKFLYF